MKLLFFAPFSGIWPHAALEARLAVALQQRGHDVVYVTCGGALHRHCVVMASMQLAADARETERNEVCRSCTARANSVRSAFGLRGPQLGEILGVGAINQIHERIDHSEDHALLVSTWDGLPVGRRALFPFLLYHKKDDLEFSPAQWRAYRDQLYQTMLSVSAARQLISQYHPDAVLTYSATYSVISAFLEVARDAGVADYFFEACGNHAYRDHRAILGRASILEWYLYLRSVWATLGQQPARPALIGEVGDHLDNLFNSRTAFAYSTASSLRSDPLRKMLGAEDDTKILLATLSSHDELFASVEAELVPRPTFVFASQLKWLDWLLEYVAARPQLHLVIRVHPREFPNRRDKADLISTHAKRLQQRLINLPPNCFVNWPDQNLSLYDLAKDVDVVLNAWSSAGKEMGLLGLPVVEWATEVLLYQPDERYCATDHDSYRSCIEKALADGWDGGTVRKLFRWCALEYGAATFVTGPLVKSPGIYDRLANFACRIARKFGGIRVDALLARSESVDNASLEAIEAAIRKRQPALINQLDFSNAAEPAEAAALARQIRRMVNTLFDSAGGVENKLKKNLLCFAESLEREAARPL